MNYLDTEQLTGCTFTMSAYKYDWFTDEILEWVRKQELTEEDAVHNLWKIMKEYERRKSFSQRFKSEKYWATKLAELKLKK